MNKLKLLKKMFELIFFFLNENFNKLITKKKNKIKMQFLKNYFK